MKKNSIPYNMLSPIGRNNGIFGIDTMVIGDRIPNKQMRNIADSETYYEVVEHLGKGRHHRKSIMYFSKFRSFSTLGRIWLRTI